MTVKVNKTYTNNTQNHQVICNTDTVVFEGSYQEAQDYLNNNVLTVSYADAVIVAPGETVTGEYVKPVQYPDRATNDSDMSYWIDNA